MPIGDPPMTTSVPCPACGVLGQHVCRAVYPPNMQPMVDPYKEAASRKAESDVRDEVHLFFEFNRAIDALTKRYGVLNVADQCRGYADFVERLRAGIEVRHIDGSPDA